ncbi:MAG TPA: hypothetical protein VGP96_00060 [Candidatus Dormibacteraeota bacterium]|nr:hypothetical protein [Candidatus Dormibacteraeota bacterium]
MTRHRADDPRLDRHPLVRAADALVRAVLAAVIAGAPVQRYGEALMVWLQARRRARQQLAAGVEAAA